MTDKLQLFSLRPQAVEIENGETVYLRRLTAADRLAWLNMATKANEDNKELSEAFNTNAELLVLCLCDKDGKRLFNNDEVKTVIEVMDEKIFWTLAAEAMKINGMGKDANEEVKKNSESIKPSSTS